MKKQLLFTLMLTLSLTVLSACGSEWDDETSETIDFDLLFRVEYVGNGEFIASGEDYNILVLYPNASIFERFDTAVIEFDEADLIKEAGSRPDGDYKIKYQYVLENPNLVRPAGPGEPTFA